MSKSAIHPIIESYNLDEEWLYNKPYLFIKGYATAKDMIYTLKALPLARKIHNGQYRKGLVTINGEDHKLPYVLHVLKVATTLLSLSLPLSAGELDILISAALLHDSIEDAEDGFFKNGGIELMTEYGFPERVYDIVKLLSKRSGATQEELYQYFNAIKKDPFALLIKLADRSHNVEDLYTMTIVKLHKYTKETREFIYPLSTYGKSNYPELSNGITILKAKIVSLTELTETLIDMYIGQLDEKDKEIEQLKLRLNRFKIQQSEVLKNATDKETTSENDQPLPDNQEAVAVTHEQPDETYAHGNNNVVDDIPPSKSAPAIATFDRIY